MKKAVNVESNFFDISLKEQMLSVKKVGFDGVFFDWSDSEEFTENVNFAREIGLEIASIHAPFDYVCDMWNKEKPEIFHKLIKCINDCGNLRVKTLVCHVYIGFDTLAKVTETGIKNFSLLIDEAEKYDLNLAFENTEGVECLYGIKKHLSHKKNCGFCIDTGHELCYNAGYDLLKDFGDKLFFLHINDNMGVTGDRVFWTDDSHIIPCKHGKVNWQRFCNNLKRLKWDEWISLELCMKNKPEKHTHDDLIGITPDEFFKMAFDSAKRIEGNIND